MQTEQSVSHPISLPPNFEPKTLGFATAEFCQAVVARVMRNATFESKIKPKNTRALLLGFNKSRFVDLTIDSFKYELFRLALDKLYVGFEHRGFSAGHLNILNLNEFIANR